MKRDDMRRYAPDLGTVLKEIDPAVLAERRRKALEDPELQAAIAEMERERAASLNPEREADEKTIPRVSAPSPWAEKDGAGVEIDKSALPSATMSAASHAPHVAEPAENPVVRSERPAATKRSFRVGWLAVLAVVAIGGPIIVLAIAKSMRERSPAEGAAPSATASVAPSATAVESAAPSATAAVPEATGAANVVPPSSAAAPLARPALKKPTGARDPVKAAPPASTAAPPPEPPPPPPPLPKIIE